MRPLIVKHVNHTKCQQISKHVLRAAARGALFQPSPRNEIPSIPPPPPCGGGGDIVTGSLL